MNGNQRVWVSTYLPLLKRMSIYRGMPWEEVTSTLSVVWTWCVLSPSTNIIGVDGQLWLLGKWQLVSLFQILDSHVSLHILDPIRLILLGLVGVSPKSVFNCDKHMYLKMVYSITTLNHFYGIKKFVGTHYKLLESLQKSCDIRLRYLKFF